ncbi:MAG: DUF1016 domain-containing protein, partial [Spirochaetia bacterium]|nr:DUF1016 domain-containing protein [Spirochaetia bacterium]
GAYANREVTLMYWEVGRYIASVVLDGDCAGYGKKNFATLSRKLVTTYARRLKKKIHREKHTFE